MGRIVVNLDSGTPVAARPKRRRRWVRILGVLAICVVALIAVIAIAGFFSWRRFQSSPEYSLTLLVDAALRNDANELAKRIDDEAIAKNMVARVNQKAVDRYGGAMNAATQQQIDKAMPSLMPRLKQMVHDEVVTEMKSLETTPGPKPFVILLMLVPRLVKITTEGDLAKAESAVVNTHFELTMRREADRWKVVDLKDDAVVQRVVDSVMKELPAIGAFDSSSPLFKNPGRSRKRRR